jgi:hypothetical protein
MLSMRRYIACILGSASLFATAKQLGGQRFVRSHQTAIKPVL